MRMLPAFLAVALASAAAAAAPLPSSVSIEGRWRLVEQHYAKGEANLAFADAPVRLEFAREGAGWTGRIWAGEDRANAVPWPAFVTDDGSVPVELVERSQDSALGSVTVRYRVRPSPTDDLVLDITESYAVSPSGGDLEGTMTVRFTGGTANRGGFELRRRFEREP